MFLSGLIALCAVFTLAAGGLVNPLAKVKREVSYSHSTCGCTTTVTQLKPGPTRLIRRADVPTACPPAVTVTQVVTVTDAPDTITVAFPDQASISRLFASGSTIDSIVVVEQSQDRPVHAPPETAIPVFTHTAGAPAVVATEVSDSGIYLTDGVVESIPVSTTIVTVILPNIGATQAAERGTFTAPDGGWNGTMVGTTILGTGPNMPTGPTGSMATSRISVGTGVSVQPVSSAASTVTLTTYITTTTQVLNETVTTTSASSEAASFGYGYGYGYPFPTITEFPTPSLVQKRAADSCTTCTLIYAMIGGSWASWCNNWNGAGTLSCTAWSTTVTDGTLPATSSMPSSTSLPPPSPSMSTSASSETAVLSMSPTPQAATLTSSTVVMSSASSQNSQTASTTTSSQPTSSSCGQVGTFVISFDDLPVFSTSDPDTVTDGPPIFNPYEHFYWSEGWSYGPPPTEPYIAHDGTRLAEYEVTSGDTTTDSPNAGSLVPGSFGAGPRAYNNNYWFDAHSAWVGCNVSDVNAGCDFVATAYKWNSAHPEDPGSPSGNEKVTFTQHFQPPICSGLENCPLTQILFDPVQFSGLSSINFYVKTAGIQAGYYVDTIELAWTNNTCAAGLARISSRK